MNRLFLLILLTIFVIYLVYNHYNNKEYFIENYSNYDNGYYVNPLENTLYLSLIASPTADIYHIKVKDKKESAIFIKTINTNDGVVNMTIPEFLQNDILKITHKQNMDNSAYIMGNWTWNNKQYHLSPTSVTAIDTNIGKYIGCYKDKNGTSILNKPIGIVPTLETCSDYATKMKLGIYGIRNGNVCYGSNEIPCDSNTVDNKYCETYSRNGLVASGKVNHELTMGVFDKSKEPAIIVCNDKTKLAYNKVKKLKQEKNIDMNLQSITVANNCHTKMGNVSYVWTAPNITIDKRVPICSNACYNEYEPKSCLILPENKNCKGDKVNNRMNKCSLIKSDYREDDNECKTLLAIETFEDAINVKPIDKSSINLITLTLNKVLQNNTNTIKLNDNLVEPKVGICRNFNNSGYQFRLNDTGDIEATSLLRRGKGYCPDNKALKENEFMSKITCGNNSSFKIMDYKNEVKVDISKIVLEDGTHINGYDEINSKNGKYNIITDIAHMICKDGMKELQDSIYKGNNNGINNGLTCIDMDGKKMIYKYDNENNLIIGEKGYKDFCPPPSTNMIDCKTATNSQDKAKCNVFKRLMGSSNDMKMKEYKNLILKMWKQSYELLNSKPELATSINYTTLTSFNDIEKVPNFVSQFTILLEQTNKLCEIYGLHNPSCNKTSSGTTFYNDLNRLIINSNEISKLI
jgi:hypothetical protein